MTLRVNLGAGPQRLEGFTSLDLTGADIIHDLRVMPWPFTEGSATELLASHVLEHFTRDEGVDFLRECRRVLAPGGVLHIAVPDMDKFIDAHLTGDYGPLGGYKWTDLNYLCGGDETEHNPAQKHRYMYGWDALAYKLELVGFSDIRFRGPRDFDNMQHAAFSLYVDGYK